jgi:hypothetical protein
MRRESLTPSERVMRARMAAYMLHARYAPRETTKAARRAFNQRFIDQVDPDRRLPGQERTRRADAARRAYFTRLAYLSARKRHTARTGPEATVDVRHHPSRRRRLETPTRRR